MLERDIAMGTENRFKMSRERLAELKEELEYLQTVREKEVAEQIKEARSFGDLSENSEYDEAKTEQGKLYSKIAEIKSLIENAEIVEVSTAAGVVGHGSHIRVRALDDGSEDEYSLVGSQEANPMEGMISSDSPFGRGLMGHKVGEVVTVEAPAGQFQYEILSVEN
ncbi:MAG: transcription elongation factor GreA [Oscillospiraceae bacterium]|nr:transcription elongation factor GreA [Oscillospiraceae bacterium]